MSKVCPDCGGVGYPQAIVSPELVEERWRVRINLAACQACDGSGLSLRNTSAAAIVSARAVNKARAKARAMDIRQAIMEGVGGQRD